MNISQVGSYLPLETPAIAPTASKARVWAGRIIGGLAVLFMLFDGAIKLANVQPVIDAHVLLGIPLYLAPVIGLLELFCVAIYVVPRTAVIGAIALTGYLGGAVAIHVRSETPFWFPLVVGALLWGSLLLRDARVRALFAPHGGR